ncbi:patatin-like phospholipase family protein [Azovibrio restrictus]|uniref:patatin-like phospholipase family protein n=1 Tax=Azovibrio restrictus TaxID=146938 RepID=UPI0026EF7769|nr:patatin-like phospholipase family protein [Azovibrio restrictus]MDD3484711.1 patatin-like phospholipase family protein [Azovibrio restrictus]
MSHATSATKPVINLGLQGGGAHGAYSWGVLDRLLEDGRFDFEGISGTSAGAMNGVVLADGLMRGGRDGARQALAEFWRAIADSVPLELSVPVAGGESVALLPATRFMLNWTQYLSPYQLNPLNFNPLRKLLKERVDFAGLVRHSPVRLFLAATNANTGKLRLFRNGELSVDAVLASACLPMLHHAIEIDGEPYWDGGYAANPAVFPLFYECSARDILLILLAPPVYGETPRTVEEIRARTLELAFNTSLLREMLLFANVINYSRSHADEAAEGWMGSRSLQRLLGRARHESSGFERHMLKTRFHLIEAQDLLRQFGSATKVAADWPFLKKLHDIGYEEASHWLTAHGPQVGKETSFDLIGRFGV